MSDNDDFDRAKKIFARLMDWSVSTATPVTVTFRVEWSQLEGGRKGGKFPIVTVPPSDKSVLANLVTKAIAKEVRAQTGVNYKAQDVLLWGG